VNEDFAAETSGTVTVTTAQGTWTLQATLTHMNTTGIPSKEPGPGPDETRMNTVGVPPRPPGPGHVPFPLRTLLSGLEEILLRGDRSMRIDLKSHS
jgi:hypothetical protein